jgi:hypothetical protein
LSQQTHGQIVVRASYSSSSSSSSSSSMAQQREVEPWLPLRDVSEIACL